MINSYVCIDIETTGLNPKTDKIIEIGAVKIENGVAIEKFETFVNPGRMLEDRIVELTGICDEDLKDAPQMDEIIPKIKEFAGDYVMLGHSVLFDYSFLKKAAVNEKIPFEMQGIDTLKLSRKYLSNLESRNLGYLCKYFQIPHQAHRALNDAEATCKLYEKLGELFYNEENQKDFVPQKLIYNVKRETPITKPQKERLYKLMEKHKLNMDYNIEQLTRNEASRYTDQILAKYGR